MKVNALPSRHCEIQAWKQRKKRLSDTAYLRQVPIAMQPFPSQLQVARHQNAPKDCLATSCEFLFDEERAEVRKLPSTSNAQYD